MLKITKINNNIPVYDITVEKTHNFFANNILVHNCQEIGLPTKPIQDLHDEDGEIATCILSAVNLGKIKHPSDLEEICDLIVRALDELIDYQDYPIRAAEISSKTRRNIGVGYINLAYYFAKNKLKWDSDEARKLIHETTEALQYYLLKSSVALAKEKGPCEKYSETKYSLGILPIDTYKHDIDEFANFEYQQDWEALRKEIRIFGVRNSTLTTIMPSESSSVTSNATNGIEPPRALLQVKKSKSGVIKMLVPEYSKLKNQYELLWDMKDNLGYLKICAIIQKFIDQCISVNTSYNPQNFDNNEIPLTVVVKDVMLGYKYGLKTFYYSNSYDLNEQSDDDNGCESGSCKI